MIKIDVNRFDQKSINEIYFDKGFLSSISSEISNHILDDSTHEIIKDLLKNWFCDDTGNVDLSKITQYLLDIDPERYIDELIHKIKEYNVEYYTVLETWTEVLLEAIGTNDKKRRKAIITKVITPTTLCMFTGITEKDLQTIAKNRTLWSNKKKVKK